jgi:hypothetical protein
MFGMRAAGKFGEHGVAAISKIITPGGFGEAVSLDSQGLQAAKELVEVRFGLAFVCRHDRDELILLGCGTFQKSPPESSGGCALDNFKAVPPRRLVGSGVVENRIDVKRGSGLIARGPYRQRE